VRGRGAVLTEELRSHVERRLRFALSRFSPRVRRVSVRLEDRAGREGELDKHCRVRVTMAHGAPLLTDTADAELVAAVDRACDLVGRLAGHRIDRPPLSAGLRRARASAGP